MKILVGIDGGPQQAAALALAAQLAKGGELVVATVYPLSRTTAGLSSAFKRAAEEAAESVLKSAGDQLSSVQYHARSVADISAPRALHRLADEEAADLIVIGACHRGAVGRALLGGTGERVVHGSHTPVVVAPRDYTGDHAISTVGVAYDGTAEAEEALTWATRFAERSGASLRLYGAVSYVPMAVYPGFAVPPSEQLDEELRAEARTRLDAAVQRLPQGLRPEGQVLDGPAIPTLVQAAQEVDLMVAGSRGYGPFGALLMGSVSRGLLHEAPSPVVVVPRGTGGGASAGDEQAAALSA